jgi:hypothetical protein
MCATVVASESTMDGGRIRRRGEGGLVSLVFSTASNGIHDFGQVPLPVVILDRRRGCANCSRKRPVKAGLFGFLAEGRHFKQGCVLNGT